MNLSSQAIISRSARDVKLFIVCSGILQLVKEMGQKVLYISNSIITTIGMPLRLMTWQISSEGILSPVLIGKPILSDKMIIGNAEVNIILDRTRFTLKGESGLVREFLGSENVEKN